MSWKELKKDFDKDMVEMTEIGAGRRKAPHGRFQSYRDMWVLKLLFEINGNLDHLAVSMRKIADRVPAPPKVGGA